MKKYKAGLVGLGRWGKVILEKGNPYFNFTHALTKNPSKHNELIQIAQLKHCSDLDELMSQDLDLIFLATPHRQHFQQTQQILMNGISVHCEPPLALSVEQMKELFSIARQKKLHLFVGYNMSHLAAFKDFKAQVDKRIGMPKKVFMEYSSNSGYRYTENPTHWRAGLNQNPLGCFSTMGDHLLFHLIENFGPVQTSHIKARREKLDYEFYDTVTMDGQLESGVKFHLKTSCVDEYCFRVVVHGGDEELIFEHDYFNLLKSTITSNKEGIIQEYLNEDSMLFQSQFEARILLQEPSLQSLESTLIAQSKALLTSVVDKENLSF